jgi:hypothetical protein
LATGKTLIAFKYDNKNNVNLQQCWALCRLSDWQKTGQTISEIDLFSISYKISSLPTNRGSIVTCSLLYNQALRVTWITVCVYILQTKNKSITLKIKVRGIILASPKGLYFFLFERISFWIVTNLKSYREGSVHQIHEQNE